MCTCIHIVKLKIACSHVNYSRRLGTRFPSLTLFFFILDQLRAWSLSSGSTCVSWEGGGGLAPRPNQAPPSPNYGLTVFLSQKIVLGSVLITLDINWIVLGMQCALVLIFISLRLLVHISTTQVDLEFDQVRLAPRGLG
jgi:hypothetical protein